MRNKIGLFIAGCFALIFTSCLGGDDYNYNPGVDKNCQIVSFTLEHSGIPELANTKFTIDQMNGRIFNIDSLPYGTNLQKAICTVGYMNSNTAGAKVRQLAVGDTIEWNAKDSLDFSKPVIFEVIAQDGVTTKPYTAHVNIHTVVPDTMIWSLQTNRINGVRMKDQKVIANGDSYLMYVKMYDEARELRLYKTLGDMAAWQEIQASGLPANAVLQQMLSYNNTFYAHTEDGGFYSSSDAVNWKKAGNAPSLKTLLGVIDATGKQASGLAAIMDNSGVLTFAVMNELGEWSPGEEVPEMFPLSGFGVSDFDAMYYNYLLVVAGRDKNGWLLNKSWSTSDGKHWVMLTDASGNYFTTREGVMLTVYDGKYYLIGGLEAGGAASSEIFTSSDRGVTWVAAEAKMVFPDIFLARGFSSIVVDKDNYLYLFSGKTNSSGNQMNDIWRGRINRLGFNK